jgi:serine/threonine-protein kinase
MNDNDTHNDDPNDRTVPAHSVPPVSSGMHGQGDPLLRSGMMLPPQAPGILGRIGKYPVIRILGEGGMGQVLLAREPVTDSLVAIKLIKPEFLNKQWAVHRFLTEARHMYKMSHPSIIRVLDVSDRPEGPYFVMPYMAGGSLAGKIQPGEPLQAETILPVARAVAEALLHAHTRGITHRDLKPSNILLDAAGQAHLADFGLLRTFNNDTIIDASQPQMEGTVPYMSPAVAAGKAEDTRSDIYSFGCLLYEMLTGHPPYQGFTVDAVLKQIQDGPPPPIRQLNPGAPAGLAAICDHAMARELRDRYASMGDVVAELERCAPSQARRFLSDERSDVSKPSQ